MKRHLSSQPLKNIIAIFILPLLLSGVIYFLSSCNNIATSKSNINTKFTDQLYDFVELNKKLTNNVFQNFLNIASFEPIRDILCSDSIPQKNNGTLADTQRILLLYMQNNPIVSNICLVNRSSNFVATESELYSMEGFFELNCKYSKYDLSFWENIHVKPNNPKLLDSGEAIIYGKNNVIIPYICTIPNTINNSSYIIVNLDIEYVYNMLKSYEYSPNAKVFLMNNSTNRCLSSDGMIDFPFNDETLINRFKSQNFSTYSNVLINNVKHYVMVASSTNSLYNYSYIVCVPNFDISNSTSAQRTAFLITIMLEIFILVVAIFIFILNIYKPLRYISIITADNIEDNPNILRGIINYIRKSSDNISSLEGTIDEILPASIQIYLYNLSKGTIEQDKSLEKLAFKHLCFLPISIEIIFKQKFYEDINMPHLSAQAIDIIQTQFELNFQTYCISKSASTLSILLNFSNENEEPQVHETINNAIKLFSNDNAYLSIYVGIGSIIYDLANLSASLKLCAEQIHTALSCDRRNIADAASIFGHKESIQLENYLINANTSAATELINAVDQSLISVPKDVVTTVYIDILLTIGRIMKLKNIVPMSQGSTSYVDYISEISKKSEKELYSYTINCIEQISTTISSSTTSFEIETVINHIQEHYFEDISLDRLAELFSTSPQYLSKRIKQHLGFTFLDYVSSLRIEKAKELLSSTTKGITEISEECGFISRNTFLRVFKKYTGVPPTEYRKNSNNAI